MVDINGNANGGTPTVPDTNIATGGLSAHELAEREAALAAAERERAAAAATAAPTLAAYSKEGHS